MRLFVASVMFCLSISGCIIYDDPYYHDCDTYYYVCPSCHFHHSGPCDRSVIILRCGVCRGYHRGRCSPHYHHR